jgi:hypothetical protein
LTGQKRGGNEKENPATCLIAIQRDYFSAFLRVGRCEQIVPVFTVAISYSLAGSGHPEEDPLKREILFFKKSERKIAENGP